MWNKVELIENSTIRNMASIELPKSKRPFKCAMTRTFRKCYLVRHKCISSTYAYTDPTDCFFHEILCNRVEH